MSGSSLSICRKEILQLKHESSVEGIDFSPDGEYLATASSNLVRLWNVKSGQETKSIWHETFVSNVAFDPQGKFLVTGAADGIVHIWEMESGREVTRVRHKDSIAGVAFSPDGKYLASASFDSTVRLWLWRPADLIAEACSRLPRTLTHEEWQQYLSDEQYQPVCPD